MPIDFTGFTLFNAIAAAGRTIYEIAQGTAKLEQKQELMDVYDSLMNLKRAAGELEDENHELKSKLRFHGDEFEFRTPFWYEKNHPERPLCTKCFASERIGPMSEPYESSGMYRACLVCNNYVRIGESSGHTSYFLASDGGGGPDGWMR